MDKKAVVLTHDGMLLSCKIKNTFESVRVTWLALSRGTEASKSEREAHCALFSEIQSLT